MRLVRDLTKIPRKSQTLVATKEGSSERGGPIGQIARPQSSQSFSKRRADTSFGDTGGDYPEVPTATLEEIAAGLQGLTQECAEFKRQGVCQPNETMGSSFEDSDYQPYKEIDRGNVMVTLGEGSFRYKNPSRGKDVDIAGQPGQRDGNLLRGSTFSSPPNQRRNFQFRSPPHSSDFSGINYRWAMSSGMTNLNPRQSGQWGRFCTFCGQIHTRPCNQMKAFYYECGGIRHVKRDCPTYRHNQEMARNSIRPNFATALTKNVRRDKGKRVASYSQGR
ncbi:Uncharacterized protein TCM_010187 [Theobroma cacao]|uniref:Uncharacterized protein n=1 Tax=Theobroma cacao TaxID=3641 RepID=A0A061E7J9_THECC|nr:Uncharacterized protein TCM_010187 [Theobroma cacao]